MDRSQDPPDRFGAAANHAQIVSQLAWAVRVFQGLCHIGGDRYATYHWKPLTQRGGDKVLDEVLWVELEPA